MSEKSSHDRVGKEVNPNSVPSDTVLLHNLVLVGDPVQVPSVEGSRIVDTEDIHRLDLKVGRFELSVNGNPLESYVTHLLDDPSERERSIGSWENVLVHAEVNKSGVMTTLHSQKTPNEILKLPAGSDTSNLEDHQTVISQEIVDLGEESAVSSDTNVLGHLETRNLVVIAFLVGDFSVVLAENSTLRFRDTIGSESLGTESSLVSGKSD